MFFTIHETPAGVRPIRGRFGGSRLEIIVTRKPSLSGVRLSRLIGGRGPLAHAIIQRQGARSLRIRPVARRGRVDAAIVAVLFQGGLRRSEAAALTWGDIEQVEGGALIHVRTSKANQEGGDVDVRFVKNGFARAVLFLRPTNARPGWPVFGGLNGQSIGRRFAAACRAAGLEGDYTGHSGRVGLAQELTRRGASTTATQLAGGGRPPAWWRAIRRGWRPARGQLQSICECGRVSVQGARSKFPLAGLTWQRLHPSDADSPIDSSSMFLLPAKWLLPHTRDTLDQVYGLFRPQRPLERVPCSVREPRTVRLRVPLEILIGLS